MDSDSDSSGITYAQRIVFFDLETTSQDHQIAEIVEIAAWKPGGEEFERFVATISPVEPFTFELTKINPEQYELEKQPLQAVLHAFLEFVGDSTLVGHNIHEYDLPILNRVLKELYPTGDGFPPEEHIDTLKWALARYPIPPKEDNRELLNYTVSGLHEYFTQRPVPDAHRALADCKATQVIFDHLLNDPPSQEVLQFWTWMKLPQVKLYPSVEPLNHDTFKKLLKVKAEVLHHNTQKETFPDVDTLFPKWLEDLVKANQIVIQDIPAFLDALKQRNQDHPRVAEVLRTHPGAADSAQLIRNLPGSFRMRQDETGHPRAAQAEMARTVQKTLQGQVQASIIQAPTGTGKTKGYLYPTWHHVTTHPGEQVIIATHTKVLQQQVFGDLSTGAKDFTTRAVLAKSARSYLCPDAFSEALLPDRGSSSLTQRHGHAAAFAFAREGKTDMDDFPGSWEGNPELREVKMLLETHNDRCRKDCDYFRFCGFQNFRHHKEHAQLVVTNQAWMLSNLSTEPSAGSAKVHLVIDEAHNLEDVATESEPFKEEVTEERLRFNLLRLFNPTTQKGVLSINHAHSNLSKQVKNAQEELIPRAIEALEAYSKQVKFFIQQHSRKSDVKYGMEMVLEINALRRSNVEWMRLLWKEDDLLKHLRSIIDLLVEVSDDPKVRWRFKPTLEYLRSSFKLFYSRREQQEKKRIYTSEWHPRQGWAHISRVIDISVELKALWASAASVTLTSATLAPSGQFDYTRQTLGLPQAQVLDLPEALPYEHAFTVLPRHLHAPTGSTLAQFQQGMQTELRALIPVAQRSLSLFTSTDRMKEAGKALEDQKVMVASGRAKRNEIMRKMMEKGERAALGTRAFMEGVDFPDLKLVSLERIPFPVPTALMRARQALVEERGGDPWYDFYLPRALLTFTQAFGRLIRDERQQSGKGLFILWDKRVLSASYREVVFSALPASARSRHQLRRPADRDAFYDIVAEVLDTPRDALPSGEWVTELLGKLRDIQHQYQSGTMDHATGIESLLKLFWDGRVLKHHQGEAILRTLKQESLLVLLPTGYGKSLAFQLPALLQGGVTVVISPLIALMEDQVNGLTQQGIPAASINASKSGAEQKTILQEVRQGRVHLLYISPERLHRSEELKKLLRELSVQHQLQRIVFDEAHCISEWGHDFRPDYRKVLTTLDTLGIQVPTTALTATATRDVLDDLQNHLHLHNTPIRATSDRPNIKYHVHKVEGDEPAVAKLLELCRALKWLEETQQEPWSAIVYVSTRATASRLSCVLSKVGFKAAAYHAGLSTALRSEIQQDFLEGNTQVMVATSAFGMGVDQRNVRLVAHFTPSKSLSSFIQEAGRAGRDQKPAHSLLLYTGQDFRTQSWLSGQNAPQYQQAEHLLHLFKDTHSLVSYPEDLLARFNESKPGSMEPLEDHELTTLLATLEKAGIIETDYRVGRVRVISTWTQDELRHHMGDFLAQHLLAQGYKPQLRPQEMDFSNLDAELAAQLNERLFALSEDHFQDFLYLPGIPALNIILKSGTLNGFQHAADKLVEFRRKELELMKGYTTSPCRRAALLKHFEEDSPAGRDRGSCCDLCSGTTFARPWTEVSGIPEKKILQEYDIKDTVLAYMADEIKRYTEKGYTSESARKGASKICMVLRGQTSRPVGHNKAVTLSSFQVKSRYFGELEFVSATEIKKSLEALVEQGLLEKIQVEQWKTYMATHAGIERAKKLQKKGFH